MSASSSTSASSELVLRLITTIFSKWKAPKTKSGGTCRCKLDFSFTNTRNCDSCSSILTLLTNSCLKRITSSERWTRILCIWRGPLVFYKRRLTSPSEAILPRISQVVPGQILRHSSRGIRLRQSENTLSFLYIKGKVCVDGISTESF